VEKSDDGAIVVRRDGRFVVEDRGSEQPVQPDFGLKASPAKPRMRRRDPDESLSDRTIIAIAAVVIAIGFAFTALLPTMFERRSVDSTARVTPPTAARPAQTEQFGATQPVPNPAPAQVQAPALPAPVSNDSTSVAKTAPVSNTTGSAPSEKQAVGRATVAAPSPSTGKTTSGEIALTADEKAAVDRGRQALEKKAPAAAPRRAAPTRPALTAEEKAAIDRGLKELAKTTGQAKR
jgi:hypothetical protein